MNTENFVVDDKSESVEERRTRDFTGIIVSATGLAVIIIGLKPEWFLGTGSLGFGFAQMITFLAGLALLSGGGFMSLKTVWRQNERSIVADFGSRLIATGYVIALFAGLSDYMGINVTGSAEKIIYFGPWEEIGLEIALIVIIIGLLMMIPYRLCKNTS